MQDTRENTQKNSGRRRDVLKISGTTARQRNAWRAAAQASEMPLASWLREAADAAVVSGTIAADLRAEIVALRTELGRGAGNNLNQLARTLNIDLRARRSPDGPAHEEALKAAARDIAAVKRKTEALLRRVERAGLRAGRR